MAQQQKMQMPGVFGGLMRYDDEYKSKFMLSPAMVVAFIVVIIVSVLVLRIFFPIPGLQAFPGAAPTRHGGFVLGLLQSFI